MVKNRRFIGPLEKLSRGNENCSPTSLSLLIPRVRPLGISQFSNSVNQYVLSPFIRNRPQLTRK
jgi:hypothetical protein